MQQSKVGGEDWQENGESETPSRGSQRESMIRRVRGKTLRHRPSKAKGFLRRRAGVESGQQFQTSKRGRDGANTKKAFGFNQLGTTEDLGEQQCQEGSWVEIR